MAFPLSNSQDKNAFSKLSFPVLTNHFPVCERNGSELVGLFKLFWCAVPYSVVLRVEMEKHRVSASFRRNRCVKGVTPTTGSELQGEDAALVKVQLVFLRFRHVEDFHVAALHPHGQPLSRGAVAQGEDLERKEGDGEKGGRKKGREGGRKKNRKKERE
ncbi:hypothetical protein L345_14340, partial [Ophiophagus hannah]